MLEIIDLIGRPFNEMKCWDLVREYKRREGKALPDYKELLLNGKPDGKSYCTEITSPRKGCVCLFALQGDCIDHVGIYLGGNQLLHATEGSGVCIERLSKYLPRLKGMYI